ncbi:MAG: ParB/RepB/Spo0J family partition protein [Cyanothece sp. SIO1E1]|nr:ParB/RepB/Spo0J family partition protein [Cyanothece sp. SIO1E1]
MNAKRDKPYSHRLKGLDAFIGSSAATMAAPTNQLIPLEKIQLPSQQPRRFFDPQKMQQLVQSVKEHGVLEPILVRPVPGGNYQLVAGERRYRAAREAGLRDIPLVVRELDDDEALQLNLIENLQREDLNPIEETEGILQLLALRLGIPVQEVISLLYRMQNAVAKKVTDNVISSAAAQTVKSVFAGLGLMEWESFIANRLPLLRLPEDVLGALRQGGIAYTKAKAIARVKSVKERQALLNRAIANELSLNEIKTQINLTTAPSTTLQTSLKDQMQSLLRQFNRAKIWDDPRKQKKLEKLLTQMQALLEG